MKSILLAALALAIAGSSSQADDLAASPQPKSARFAAMSLTKDQGLRAIVSNVLVPANGTALAPCPVQVSFFGADGSPFGDAASVQLKAGESAIVPASDPSKLVRAVVNIGDVADPAKVCALRTSVEIFDVQTGMTFVSVPGESIGRNSECSVSAAPALAAVRNTIPGRKNARPVAISPSVSGGTAPPKPRSPVLAATPPAAPR